MCGLNTGNFGGAECIDPVVWQMESDRWDRTAGSCSNILDDNMVALGIVGERQSVEGLALARLAVELGFQGLGFREH